MKIKLVETGVDSPDFLKLNSQLEAYYNRTFREISANYQQHHALNTMKCGVVAYADGEPAGCGAFKVLAEDTAEMKRIYVPDSFRRLGIASRLMKKLEEIAAAQGISRAVLETGVEMQDAIAFYQKIGYAIVPNFGAFVGDPICLCMAKELTQSK